MAGTGREPFNVTAPRTTPTAPNTTRSPWHSPVPYLFGGLAAMLGLIAFALLILACSYWKLSGYLENGNNEGGERDLEAGESDNNKNGEKQVVFEEKILVIMAGQVKPTFLATPMSSRSSSFGDDNNNNNNNNKTCCCGEKNDKFENGSSVELVKQQQEGSSTGGDNSETQESSQSQ